MGEDKKYYWLKLKEDFFRQAEIKKPRKIAGGDTYTIIYLKMQLLSNSSDNQIYYIGIENTLIEEIALELDESIEDVNYCITILLKLKLAYFTDNSLVINKVTNKRNRGTEQYRQWRKSVFERDNYTCIYCHQRGIQLNAHHVRSWANNPSQRFNIHNGITLCEKCHKELHKRVN